MTCLSKEANNVVDKIRKTLFNFDLQIAQVEAEIKNREEIMDLHCCSTKKKDLEAFTIAKIEKENYEVFAYRLKEQKKNLVDRVSLIAKKYEGKYSQIFMLYFFENLSHQEIATRIGYSVSRIDHIVARMKKDIIYFK